MYNGFSAGRRRKPSPQEQRTRKRRLKFVEFIGR